MDNVCIIRLYVGSRYILPDPACITARSGATFKLNLFVRRNLFCFFHLKTIKKILLDGFVTRD